MNISNVGTVNVEEVESAVVARGRRAVGEGDAAAVQAGVGLAHGANVNGAAAEAEPPVEESLHTPSPPVTQPHAPLAAVPRQDRLALLDTPNASPSTISLGISKYDNFTCP